MKTKVAFLVLIMATFLFSACARTDGQGMIVGSEAPDFTLADLNGEEVVLSDVLKTKTVVLDFWATWCPHCITVIPKLQKLYTENSERLTVIGVNIKETQEQVAKLAKSKGATYPIVLDADGSIATLYQVRGIPTIVAIGQDGKIQYYGHSVEKMLEQIK